MPDTFAPPASKLSATGVPLGPLPRPAEFPQEWPIGMVGLWYGTAETLPTNFRVLDGSTLGTVAQYDKLAARCPALVSGNNVVLPDISGVFPKGTSGAVGSTGGSNTNSHTHSMQGHTHHTDLGSADVTPGSGDSIPTLPGDITSSGPSVADTGAPSDTNNQPAFHTFLFVIRVA